jgi:hypothetical protein
MHESVTNPITTAIRKKKNPITTASVQGLKKNILFCSGFAHTLTIT